MSINPSTLLERYADLAEQHGITPLTEAGAMLQKDYAAVLRHAAIENAPSAALVADVATITARNLVSISMAFHGGSVCTLCATAYLLAISRALDNEVAVISSAANSSGRRH